MIRRRSDRGKTECCVERGECAGIREGTGAGLFHIAGGKWNKVGIFKRIFTFISQHKLRYQNKESVNNNKSINQSVNQRTDQWLFRARPGQCRTLFSTFAMYFRLSQCVRLTLINEYEWMNECKSQQNCWFSARRNTASSRCSSLNSQVICFCSHVTPADYINLPVRNINTPCCV